MKQKYWIAPIEDIWEFQKLAFFLKNVEDLIGIDQNFILHGAFIAGDDIYLREEVGLPGVFLNPGDGALVFSSQAASFTELLDAFGVASGIVDVEAFAASGFSLDQSGTPFPRNAARMTTKAFQDYLSRHDGLLEDFMSGAMKAHLNAPVMAPDDGDTAPFYDPSGDCVSLPMGDISLPILKEQIRALGSICEGTANPYTRGLIFGLCRMLNELGLQNEEAWLDDAENDPGDADDPDIRGFGDGFGDGDGSGAEL